MVPHQEEDMDR